MNKEKIIKARIPKPLFDYLEDVKKKTGVSISEIIRFSLIQYIQILILNSDEKNIQKLKYLNSLL